MEQLTVKVAGFQLFKTPVARVIWMTLCMILQLHSRPYPWADNLFGGWAAHGPDILSSFSTVRLLDWAAAPERLMCLILISFALFHNVMCHLSYYITWHISHYITWHISHYITWHRSHYILWQFSQSPHVTSLDVVVGASPMFWVCLTSTTPAGDTSSLNSCGS